MSAADASASRATCSHARGTLLAHERELERRVRACENAMGEVRRRIVAADIRAAGVPRAAEALVRLGRDLVQLRTDLAVVRRTLRRLDGEPRASRQ